jgi:hypothetical protein
MLDRQTVLVLVGLFALVVLAFGFAVRPWGRGSRFRRAPYGRTPGQVPIVGHRTALEINLDQQKLAAMREARAAARAKRAGHADDAPRAEGSHESEPRREQA